MLCKIRTLPECSLPPPSFSLPASFLKLISPCRALFLSSRCCVFLEYHDISLPVVPPASIVPPHQVYLSVCYGTIVKFRTIFKCCAIDHTGVAWTPARSSAPPLFLHTYTTLTASALPLTVLCPSPMLSFLTHCPFAIIYFTNRSRFSPLAKLYPHGIPVPATPSPSGAPQLLKAETWDQPFEYIHLRREIYREFLFTFCRA